MIETQKSNRWNPSSPLSEKPSTRAHGPLSSIQKQFSWAKVFILAGVAISQLTLADDHNKAPSISLTKWSNSTVAHRAIRKLRW
jgi:hypothetical protein